MQFFLPHTRDEAHTKQLYEAARKFCEKQTDWSVIPKKIAALRYRHNGREYIAAVGNKDYSEGEVLCIFETEIAFLVCTEDRGVFRGEPIIVGREEVSDVEYFDEA